MLIICIANINQVVHKALIAPEATHLHMIWLYRFLFPLLFLLGLPFYLLRMFRRGGYGQMMAGRFGLVDVPQVKSGSKRVWIQAVSVGELLAIEGLVRQLCEQPGIEVVLSTTTSTGFELAKQKYKDVVIEVVSFPLDFWFTIRAAWNRICPDVCIITEAELWPEHIETARRRKIPLLLINARLSDKSFQRMSSNRWIKSLFFQNITCIGASSEDDAGRILKLGFDPKKMTVTGNLKFDVGSSAKLTIEQRNQLVKEIWGADFTEGIFTVIGASTWPGEEQLLVEALLELKEKGVATRLLITPRHAERRAEIRGLLEGYGKRLNWRFRSRSDWALTSDGADALDVYVADTTGELKNLIQTADLAVIGRSFPPHTEGQTPIEAAVLGIPVVYGPSLSNFRSICRALEKANGSVRVNTPEALPEVLFELFQQPEKREQMRDASTKVFEQSRGSTQRTLEMISKYF